MVELHVNVNCEGIKNYNYEDHSTLGKRIQYKTVGRGEPPTKIIYAVWLQLFIKKIDTHGHSM